MALNDKQERFAQEYIIDRNATQAAIRAGYSPKTAYSQGQRLLKHVEVSNLINKGTQEAADRTLSDQDEALEEVKKVAMKPASDRSDSELKYSNKMKALELYCKLLGMLDKPENKIDEQETEEDPLSKALREEAERMDNANQ